MRGDRVIDSAAARIPLLRIHDAPQRADADARHACWKSVELQVRSADQPGRRSYGATAAKVDDPHEPPMISQCPWRGFILVAPCLISPARPRFVDACGLRHVRPVHFGVFAFVYWRTAAYMTSSIDSLLTGEVSIIAPDTPERLTGTNRQSIA